MKQIVFAVGLAALMAAPVYAQRTRPPGTPPTGIAVPRPAPQPPPPIEDRDCTINIPGLGDFEVPCWVPGSF